MSADWPIVQLKDVTTILGDGLHGTPNYDDNGDYFFINGNNLCKGKIVITEATKRTSHEEYIKHKKNINDRTILVSINGTLGNVAFYNNEKVILGKSACYFNVKDDVNKYFVRYIIESKIFQSYIHSLATGSTIKNVSLKLMREFSFSLPPRPIQDYIEKILKSLDNKIELNTQTNQTLEQIAQAIFKSWFVDFDPVKAKIAALEAGGTQEAAELAAMCVISGKDEAQLAQLKIQDSDAYQQLAQTAALFPAAMQESELGEIPDGWDVKKISEFGSVICGKTPSKSEPKYFGLGMPFIKIPDMHNEVYVVNPTEQLTILGSESQKNKTIPSGSICVSCIATVGKVVMTHEPSQTNQQINSIIPKKPEYAFYLFFQMKNKNQEFHDLASGGSATLNMNTSTFSKVNILLPSVEILKIFEFTINPIFKNILRGQKESKELAELRDSLLPKLLSGEIVLSEMEPV
jgi:type I restriction enzyme S subunit